MSYNFSILSRFAVIALFLIQSGALNRQRRLLNR
jgi:hypothetical protein